MAKERESVPYPDDVLLARDLLAALRERIGRDVAWREPLHRLHGGFVTDVLAFRLEGAPEGWDGRLVLRLYPAGTEASAVRRERCAQDVVAAAGLPAPRVLACDETPTALGRPFLVMEHLPGRPQIRIDFPGLLLEGPRLLSLPRRHAAAMRQLHALDPAPLLQAFAQAGIDRRAAGPEHWLDVAETTISRWGLDGLHAGLAWLRANRPPDPPRLSICHGDLFGANVLEQHGRVSGLVDWNCVTVADPSFDVGGQVAGYEMSAVPGPRIVQLLVVGHGQLLARGLLAEYRRAHPLAEDRIRYYAAMRAFVELTHKLGREAEVRTTGVSQRMPTWRPDQCARYFRRRTGVALGIAPSRRA